MPERDITKPTPGVDVGSMNHPDVGSMYEKPAEVLGFMFDKTGIDESGGMTRAEEPDPVATQYTREALLPDPPPGDPAPRADTYTERDRTAARQAMKRGGFAPESVDLMFDTDPEAATRNGLALMDRQSGVDAKLDRTDQEIAALKRMLAEQNRQADKPAGGDTPSDAGLDEAAKVLAEELGLEGKESRAALGAFAKAVREPLLKQLQSGLPTGGTGNEGELVADFLVESARGELVGEFPQLNNADVFANVKQTARALAEARYAHLSPVDRVKASFRSAALVELGSPDAGAEVDSQTRRQRLDSQPPRPSASQTGTKPAPTKDKYASARAVLKKHGI